MESEVSALRDPFAEVDHILCSIEATAPLSRNHDPLHPIIANKCGIWILHMPFLLWSLLLAISNAAINTDMVSTIHNNPCVRFERGKRLGKEAYEWTCIRNIHSPSLCHPTSGWPFPSTPSPPLWSFRIGFPRLYFHNSSCAQDSHSPLKCKWGAGRGDVFKQGSD